LFRAALASTITPFRSLTISARSNDALSNSACSLRRKTTTQEQVKQDQYQIALSMRKRAQYGYSSVHVYLTHVVRPPLLLLKVHKESVQRSFVDSLLFMQLKMPVTIKTREKPVQNHEKQRNGVISGSC
jgi:hypothetical protein